MTHSRSELRARLKTMLAELGFRVDEPFEKIEMTVTTSGWDSASHVEVIMALEETFNIELSNDEAEVLTSVSKILKHLERLNNHGTN